MPRPPNVLLFFTDMQRFDTIAALGNPVIATPNLDRLVREGCAFTRCYTPSPVCVSARCALHYGRYPSRSGCVDNGPWMPDDGTSYAHRLGAAGYHGHAIGKMHIQPDFTDLRGLHTRELQEEIVGSKDYAAQIDDYQKYLEANGGGHILDPHGVRGEMYYIPQPAQMPAEHHPTQWVGDRSIAYIEERSASAQPWYLMSSFIHPHPPFSPPAPWHKLYRGPNMPLPFLPPQYDAHWCYHNRVQNRYKYRDQGFDHQLLRQIKAYYYACISFVDYQVGRVLDCLEAQGVLDETMILFSSDHGDYLGDFGCFGKRAMHDPSARVPLLARYPSRFTPGTRCDAVSSLVDLAPTICASAGADASGYDGVDLAQLAAGEVDRSVVYSQFGSGNDGCYMAVSERGKYWYSAADDEEFMYDMRHDPQESRRVAAGPFADPHLAELKQSALHFLADCGQEAAIEREGSSLRWRRYPTKSLDRNPDARLMVQDMPWAVERQSIPGYSDR